MIITGVWDEAFVGNDISCRFATTVPEMYDLIKEGKLIYLHVPAATRDDVNLTEVYALIGEMSEDIAGDQHFYNLNMSIDSETALNSAIFDFDSEDPDLYLYTYSK